MRRIRVTGKKENKQNIDYISKLQDEYGLKRSTIMSYWKDAVKQNPGMEVNKLYDEVVSYIEDDQNLTE